MGDSSLRFRVNHPSVIHESIDGEVIIVNLDSGSYYSVDAVGADVWDQLSAGASVDEAAQRLANGYGVEPDVVAEALGPFVGELTSEALLIPVDGAPAQPPGIAIEGPKPTFAPPRLNKYTDMQDLLLLDPIHDVDEAGWPSPRSRDSH